ncbi:MAG: flavin reductase family protein [Oligoflexia bacterium]|nr:flavin reductase family protein [Oligoflexia bacterium]
MRLFPDALRARQIYRLMTSAITPRPIAWTGTRSPSGVDNLAPFSYFMGVSSSPPAIAISVARAGRDAAGNWLLKDTARNILATGDFTVSIVTRSQAPAMVQSSGRFAADVSEFDAVGVPCAQAECVAVCYPADAPVTLECRLIHSHDLGKTHLFVGEVLLFHIADAVLADAPSGKDGGVMVDPARVDPVSRLGGQDYASIGEIFSLSPPVPPSSRRD